MSASNEVVARTRLVYPIMIGLVKGAIVMGVALLAGAQMGTTLIVASVVVALLASAAVEIHHRTAISTPREELRSVIRTTVADGDLSRRAISRGPLKPLADDYNALMASFLGIISRVIFNAKQVDASAKKLIANSTNMVTGSEQQHSSATSAAAAASAMADGISAIKANTDQTSQIAEAALENSARGARIVREASTEIVRLAQSVENSAVVVSALGERSDAISAIVNTIHEIADQTNLLALNAAIEAARAGEQGRGFAVVADEVRKLAERTTAATSEIGTLISAIQNEIQSAISAIREGSSQARTGANLANQAAEALTDINRGAEETLTKVRLIADTMAEQTQQANHIADQARGIIEMAERNTLGARSTLSEASQLNYLATNLDEIGTVFKLGASGEESRAIHERMPSVVQQVCADVTKAFNDAVDRGAIKLEDFFDENYTPIPNTKPQKFHTKFDALTDSILPPITEPWLDRTKDAAFITCGDRNGYIPTHNKKFCQPLTGDEKKDMVGNRTKRLFTDVVAKRGGTHQQPFLIQTYRRDTGEIMHDISAPIFIKGRHWGCVRIGYKA
ncbi:MAG TPA: methyl-accepting chemotaxis protein [Rhodocyclaceae bacterium]